MIQHGLSNCSPWAFFFKRSFLDLFESKSIFLRDSKYIFIRGGGGFTYTVITIRGHFPLSLQIDIRLILWHPHIEFMIGVNKSQLSFVKIYSYLVKDVNFDRFLLFNLFFNIFWYLVNFFLFLLKRSYFLDNFDVWQGTLAI